MCAPRDSEGHSTPSSSKPDGSQAHSARHVPRLARKEYNLAARELMDVRKVRFDRQSRYSDDDVFSVTGEINVLAGQSGHKSTRTVRGMLDNPDVKEVVLVASGVLLALALAPAFDCARRALGRAFRLLTGQSRKKQLVSKEGYVPKAHAVRLQPGDELYSRLLHFVRFHNLKACAVVTCVGSLTSATIRLAEADASTADDPPLLHLNEKMEITSLVGTLCSKNKGHMHVTLARADGSVMTQGGCYGQSEPIEKVGGHCVGNMQIFTTAEVVLMELDGLHFERTFDPETGFDELCVSAEPLEIYTTSRVALVANDIEALREELMLEVSAVKTARLVEKMERQAPSTMGSGVDLLAKPGEVATVEDTPQQTQPKRSLFEQLGYNSVGLVVDSPESQMS